MTVTQIPLGSPWRYIPTIGAALALGIIFIALAGLALFWYIRMRKPRWGLFYPISLMFMALGWLLRIGPNQSESAMTSIAIYAVQSLFIVLSPICFLLFNYTVFGHFLIKIDPDLTGDIGRKTCSKYSLLPPRLFSRIFFWADLIAFIVQASAGGMQAVGGSTRVTGDTLFLIGVSFQLVSYAIFLVLVIVTHARLAKESPRFSASYLLSSQPAPRVLATIYFSSLFILIRSVYRIVEMQQGYEGVFYSREVYLIALDTVPLALATACWLYTSVYELLERCTVDAPGPNSRQDSMLKEWA